MLPQLYLHLQVLSVAVYNHYKRIFHESSLPKSKWLVYYFSVLSFLYFTSPKVLNCGCDAISETLKTMRLRLQKVLNCGCGYVAVLDIVPNC